MPRTETDVATVRATYSPEASETIGRLKAKLRAYGEQIKGLTAERDTAAARAAKAEADYGESPLKAEVDRLKAEVRNRDHRAVFDRVAKAAGVPEDALDLVYQSTGYKADRDRPDEAAIAELVEGAKARPGVSRLFQADAQADRQAGGDRPAPTPPNPADRAVPGAGRGAAHKPGTSGITLTREQLSDPKFMLAKKNQDAIRDAAKNGRIKT